jgi:hypothetical protein
LESGDCTPENCVTSTATLSPSVPVTLMLRSCCMSSCGKSDGLRPNELAWLVQLLVPESAKRSEPLTLSAGGASPRKLLATLGSSIGSAIDIPGRVLAAMSVGTWLMRCKDWFTHSWRIPVASIRLA